MNMEVWHRLLGTGPVRLDQVQSQRREYLVHGPRDTVTRIRDSGKCLIANVKDGRKVLLRQNETMPVISRIDVHDCERAIVLQKLKARHLPGNDLAEDAVSIGFHLCLLPKPPRAGPVKLMLLGRHAAIPALNCGSV